MGFLTEDFCSCFLPPDPDPDPDPVLDPDDPLPPLAVGTAATKGFGANSSWTSPRNWRFSTSSSWLEGPVLGLGMLAALARPTSATRAVVCFMLGGLKQGWDGRRGWVASRFKYRKRQALPEAYELIRLGAVSLAEAFVRT